MPTPQKPMVIIVKASSASQYETVYVTNLTRGGTISKSLNASKEAIFNTKDESQTSWASGDTILVSCRGLAKGSTTGTLTAGGAKVSLTVATDTSTSHISL